MLCKKVLLCFANVSLTFSSSSHFLTEFQCTDFRRNLDKKLCASFRFLKALSGRTSVITARCSLPAPFCLARSSEGPGFPLGQQLLPTRAFRDPHNFNGASGIVANGAAFCGRLRPEAVTVAVFRKNVV